MNAGLAPSSSGRYSSTAEREKDKLSLTTSFITTHVENVKIVAEVVAMEFSFL